MKLQGKSYESSKDMILNCYYYYIYMKKHWMEEFVFMFSFFKEIVTNQIFDLKTCLMFSKKNEESNKILHPMWTKKNHSVVYIVWKQKLVIVSPPITLPHHLSLYELTAFMPGRGRRRQYLYNITHITRASHAWKALFRELF